MKKLLLLLAFLFFGLSNGHAQHLKKDGTPDRRYSENKTQSNSYSETTTNPETVPVKSYVKKDGTVVKAHDRTAPNATETDNWSAKPNVNPETGKKGTKEPED